jgi:hypothetical protein
VASDGPQAQGAEDAEGTLYGKSPFYGHFNGKINSKWQFSIAMLNYQRVSEIRFPKY